LEEFSWIRLTYYEGIWQFLVNAVMNLWVQYFAGKFFISWGSVSYPRKTQLRRIEKSSCWATI
jgi:hypothetical protein